jgi:Ca-activated chloride channel homolog
VFRTWLVVLVLVIGLPATSFSQDPPPAAPGQETGQETGKEPSQEPEPGFRIGVAVNQIFLPVTARFAQGGFARGLTRNDFQIIEDGVKQEIANCYSEASVPVNVVLLMDISGSTRSAQSEIKRAALEFAKNLSPEDKVAVVVFNFQPRLILNWSNDLAKIQNALDSVYPRGTTMLHDALFVTFDDLLKDVEGRKAVLLLTDGADTGSTIMRDEVVRLAADSEAVIYVVSNLDDYWAGAIAMRMELQAHAQLIPRELSDQYIIENKRFLQRLSGQTGGKVLETSAYPDLPEVFKAVADELKNQYYISYIPSNIQRDGAWRNLEIRALHPGVVTNTRPGYYAPRDR